MTFDWTKIDTNTIVGGVAPDGGMYLKYFLIDYKTEFNVVSFFTENKTINNNLIDASDEVEMNIDNEETNNIENILDEPTHNPTNDTTEESAQNENKQNKINLDEKRKKNNQKRREQRKLKKKQT
jgi:hypothetical protein